MKRILKICLMSSKTHWLFGNQKKTKNSNDCGVFAMMNIYALWHERLPLEDLKNIQYLKYWIASEVAKVKNDKMFNLKKLTPEDETMKIKT